MRISDWSSDVCSSDLGGFASFKGNPVSLPPGWTSDGLFRRLARASGKDWSKATVSSAPVWPDGSAVYSGQLRSLAPARLGGTRYGFRTPGGREIGRASCRERVCQYV